MRGTPGILEALLSRKPEEALSDGSLRAVAANKTVLLHPLHGRAPPTPYNHSVGRAEAT